MSTLLHKAADPHIDPEKPWDNDDFQREEYGKRLTRLVTNTPGSFVIALKAPWGAGKSIFLKRWEAHLELPETADKPYVPVVHVDAWRNDYLEEPLTAFVLALQKRLKASTANENRVARAVSGMIKTAPKLIFPLAKLLTKALPLGKSDAANLTLEFGEKAISNVLKQAELHESHVDKFTRELLRARSILCPKPTLPAATRKPLIFVVDELDRCRPDFAIKALERIKHFFGVPGIVFVIATDGDNLPNAVKTLYGPFVDGERYLRKFFDYEFSLPKPVSTAMAASLFRETGLLDRILTLEPNQPIEHILRRWQKGDYRSTQDSDSLALIEAFDAFSIVSRKLNLSARDCIQAMTVLMATIRTAPDNSLALLPALVAAIGIRFRWVEAFDLLRSNEVNLGDILSNVSNHKLKTIESIEMIRSLRQGDDRLSKYLQCFVAGGDTAPPNRRAGLRKTMVTDNMPLAESELMEEIILSLSRIYQHTLNQHLGMLLSIAGAFADMPRKQ